MNTTISAASVSEVLGAKDRTNWDSLLAGSQVVRALSEANEALWQLTRAASYSDIQLRTAHPSADFKRMGTFKSVQALEQQISELGLRLPIDHCVLSRAEGSPLGQPLQMGKLILANRFAIHPMEGCNAYRNKANRIDGSPSAETLRSWALYGLSGAAMVAGGEAMAITEDARANPRQTLITPSNAQGIADLVSICRFASEQKYGADCEQKLFAQLTHSGRNCRPDDDIKKPKVMFHHPIYDPANEAYQLTDTELDEVVELYVRAAKIAQQAGFDGVDVKACHGYLLHESLSAFTRKDSKYGGEALEQRANLILTIIDRIKEECPGLEIMVRLSAYDSLPRSLVNLETGEATAEAQKHFPYRYAFGVNPENPLEVDLTEPIALCQMLKEHGVSCVSVTAGNPYQTSFFQRGSPADMFKQPEPHNPLLNVHCMAEVARKLKVTNPELVVIGGTLSAMETYYGNLAQSLVREGWFDMAGYGRRVLSDPLMPDRLMRFGDQFEWHPEVQKSVCRSFLACVAAMRSDNPLGAGCFPLVDYYREHESHQILKDWLRKNKPVKKA